ncbi:MAG: type II toxin-antitoxin system RelE/ParE family toxin [Bacteroidia bacterium]
MDLEFNSTDLIGLYQGKKVKNKLYKSNPTLVKQFIKTIKFLEQVKKIEDLLQLKGLHYEKLTKDRVGQSSVRINDQYRLIFIENYNEENPPKVVLLQIEEIIDYH